VGVGEGHGVGLLTRIIGIVSGPDDNFKFVNSRFECTLNIGTILPESVGSVKNLLIVEFDFCVGIDAFEDEFVVGVFEDFFVDGEVEGIAVVAVGEPLDQREVLLEEGVRDVAYG
jgi:hypothetical protein